MSLPLDFEFKKNKLFFNYMDKQLSIYGFMPCESGSWDLEMGRWQ